MSLGNILSKLSLLPSLWNTKCTQALIKIDANLFYFKAKSTKSCVSFLKAIIEKEVDLDDAKGLLITFCSDFGQKLVEVSQYLSQPHATEAI